MSPPRSEPQRVLQVSYRVGTAAIADPGLGSARFSALSAHGGVARRCAEHQHLQHRLRSVHFGSDSREASREVIPRSPAPPAAPSRVSLLPGNFPLRVSDLPLSQESHSPPSLSPSPPVRRIPVAPLSSNHSPAAPLTSQVTFLH